MEYLLIVLSLFVCGALLVKTAVSKKRRWGENP